MVVIVTLQEWAQILVSKLLVCTVTWCYVLQVPGRAPRVRLLGLQHERTTGDMF